MKSETRAKTQRITVSSGKPVMFAVRVVSKKQPEAI
jgi:hypothetical protein